MTMNKKFPNLVKNLQINRITSQKFQKNTRNYYPRPTLYDLQFEERFPLRSIYNNKSIYEWNIDEISEYETLNVVQEMIMASITYLVDNDDHIIVQYLIVGFVD